MMEIFGDDDRDGLYRDGSLTDEERAACHARMRKAGTFPPVDTDAAVPSPSRPARER